MYCRGVLVKELSQYGNGALGKFQNLQKLDAYLHPQYEGAYSKLFS